MSAYRYQALDRDGATVSGVAEGDRPQQVRAVLRSRGLMPLVVEAVRSREASPARWGWRRALSGRDLSLLTRQFSTLLRAGLTVEAALSALVEQASSVAGRDAVAALRSRVREGRSLASAMDEMPRSFPRLYRRLIAAGEASGQLDEILERLADHAENRQTLQQKVMLALLYPALLTVVAVAVVAGLLVTVVPQVARVFENTGQSLPAATRFLVGLSHALRFHGGVVLLSLSAIAGAVMTWLRLPTGREQWDRWQLSWPVAGRLVRGFNAAQFANTLGILFGSGVPLGNALASAEEVMGNRLMKRAAQEARQRVLEGGSLAGELSKSRLFPPLLVNLIASGEASGNLDALLRRAAQIQQRDLESTVAALTALVEPLLILTMGGVVLFIVVAILAPIVGMNQWVR